MSAAHQVSVSGGKDSTATYLLAVERRERTGREFRAVFADTGHEHPAVYEYVQRLHERTGGPAVETVRADFAARIASKRALIAQKWAEKGVPEHRIAGALDVLQPTGNPYVDLCLWKGRFPGAKSRFCTAELKAIPLDARASEVLRAGRDVVSWQGVRAAESQARSRLPPMQRVRRADCGGRVVLIWRPLLGWSLDDVWAMHAKHGLARNPLYDMGVSRVGCWPCIFARKAEIRVIDRRDPAAFARLAAWEALVAAASRRGLATFFPFDKTPEGVAQMADIDRRAGGDPARRAELVGEKPWIGAERVAEWARTGRGGRQLQLDLEPDLDEMDAAAGCTSELGLCE